MAAITELDEQRISQALDLAELAIGLSDPNPRVGCIIGTPDGRVLGQGYTQAAGGAHAEVMALRAAAEATRDVRFATVWVTLEPCAHQGRTPPCCDALVAAGVSRVVVALGDPNPLVAGQGLARLRAAGIQVDLIGGALSKRAVELNIGFLTRVTTNKPWVRLKMAASLDGHTALPNGVSQWITGPQARADGHHWRKRAGAVLTGIGTVLADDPSLTVRAVPTYNQPLRVVVDSQLRTPLNCKLMADASALLLAVSDSADAATIEQFQLRGAEVIQLPSGAAGLDLTSLLGRLAQRGVNELHVEAGAKLNGSLLRAGLVDEVLLYTAPLLLGEGAGLIAPLGLQAPADAPRFNFQQIAQLGGDLRLILRPHRLVQAAAAHAASLSA